MDTEQLLNKLTYVFPELWECAVNQSGDLASLLGESICEYISPLITKCFVEKDQKVTIINGKYKGLYHQWVILHSREGDIIVDGSRKQFDMNFDRLEIIRPNDPDYENYLPTHIWYTNNK